MKNFIDLVIYLIVFASQFIDLHFLIVLYKDDKRKYSWAQEIAQNPGTCHIVLWPILNS